MMQILERVIEKSEFEGNYSEFYHSGRLFQPSPSLSNCVYIFIYHLYNPYIEIYLCKKKNIIIDHFLPFLWSLFVQFGNKVVAQAACDVFQLLITHWERLQRFDPTMPKKIIEVTETPRRHYTEL